MRNRGRNRGRSRARCIGNLGAEAPGLHFPQDYPPDVVMLGIKVQEVSTLLEATLIL